MRTINVTVSSQEFYGGTIYKASTRHPKLEVMAKTMGGVKEEYTLQLSRYDSKHHTPSKRFFNFVLTDTGKL